MEHKSLEAYTQREKLRTADNDDMEYFYGSSVADMQDDKNDADGSSWSYGLQHYLLTLAEVYGVPVGQVLVSFFYGIYLRFTFSNIIIFSIKYIPPGYYMYKCIKDILVKSHERLKQKQIELEDIQLKIEIVKTKLCVRDSEFSERAEILRREKERLRRVRFRVKNMIASDESLRRAMEAAINSDEELDLHLHVHSSTQEDEFATELLQCIKSDRIAIPDRLSDKIECGEYKTACDQASPENSIYSSLSDMDVRKECRVKIVKVTNVYKVAYLKHYIKQKRLRRANKRALLNKKMGNIKKMMEDWQKTLNMVINTTVMNMELHPLDVTSQEAMGDYTKLRDSSSESDLRPYNDAYYNDSWTHSPFRPFSQYEEQQHGALRDYCYDQDMSNGDIKCCDCFGQAARKMHAIVEETGSQVAIEEVSSDEEPSRTVGTTSLYD